MAQQAASDSGAADNDAKTAVLQFHCGGLDEALNVDVLEPVVALPVSWALWRRV